MPHHQLHELAVAIGSCKDQWCLSFLQRISKQQQQRDSDSMADSLAPSCSYDDRLPFLLTMFRASTFAPLDNNILAIAVQLPMEARCKQLVPNCENWRRTGRKTLWFANCRRTRAGIRAGGAIRARGGRFLCVPPQIPARAPSRPHPVQRAVDGKSRFQAPLNLGYIAIAHCFRHMDTKRKIGHVPAPGQLQAPCLECTANAAGTRVRMFAKMTRTSQNPDFPSLDCN